MHVKKWRNEVIILLVCCTMIMASPGYSADITILLKTGMPLPTDIGKVIVDESTVLDAPVSIELSGAYDAATRAVDLRAIICTYEALPADTRIVVVVTEDSLIVPSGGTGDVQDVQRVVRQQVTGQSGELLSGEPIPKDVCLMKRYSFALDQQWDTGDCTVVVIVHLGGNVLQAARVKISVLKE